MDVFFENLTNYLAQDSPSRLWALLLPSYICPNLISMKKLFFVAICLVAGSALFAQITPAGSGVVYGKVSDEGQVVSVEKLEASLKENVYQGKISGKVTEVCQAEGCWIKLEKPDGTAMMVRAKNHAFVMPTDLVGHTVVIEGEASVKEVSESQRRHYAEDAGKSQAEIAKIKGAEKQIVFYANGVKVQ